MAISFAVGKAGAGWGPIALSLALDAPDATVWAVDVNERALDLVRRNAARLGLVQVNAALPDDVPDDVRFATIWSNPPIRIGKAALHELLGQWLPRLSTGGEAWLVVQRNLGCRNSGYQVVDTLFGLGYQLRQAGALVGLAL